MHIVLGATGHVGSAVAMALLDRGEPVIVVTRDPRKAERFIRRGGGAAIADIHDTDALRPALQRGRSAFLLMPPAAPSTDTVGEEHRTVASIVRALAGTQLEKVVVQSAYGAQPGEGLGDLGVLYDFEQAVTALGVRTSIIRAAYYMSNWDSALDTARDTAGHWGKVQTFFPPDFALPMVAPADLGRVAARLLTEEIGHTGVRYVEGPTPYSARDVARAFAQALGREVRTVETPPSQWRVAYQSLGFSPIAAESYARMTAVTLDGVERPDAPERGSISLSEYVNQLVRRAA
jgi:uncharacterized protein YbjT (DUF2867 family)